MTEGNDLADAPGRRTVLKTIAATGLVVQGGGRVAGAFGGAGTANDGGSTGDDDPTAIRDGGSYWIGLRLETNAFSSADAPIELHRDDADGSTFRTQLPIDDGRVTVSTAGRPPGEYSLRARAGEPRVEFTLREQEYSVAADPDGVASCSAPTTDLEITSNRIEYTHVIDSPDIETDTLRSVFGGLGRVEDVDDDGTDEIVVETDDGTEEVLSVDFEGFDGGEYTIDFTVRDTGVTTSTDVLVYEFSGPCDPPPSRSIVPSSVRPGGSLSVTLSVDLLSYHDPVSIRDGYIGPVDGASVESIALDGSELADGKVTASEADASGLSVDVEGVSAGTLEVTYSLSVSPEATAGSTVGFTGVPGVPDVSAEDSIGEFGTDLVTVAASAVDAADTDGDGDIDDSELRSAIVDWSSGRFSDSDLRDIIVEWSS